MSKLDATEMKDYEAIAHRAALFHDVSRVTWRLTGDRVIEALQGLLTADVRGPEARSVIPSFILTPKGRPLAELRVWKGCREESDVLIDLPLASVDRLREHLGRYLPPRFAAVEPAPRGRILHLVGPVAGSVLESALPPSFAVPAPDRCAGAGDGAAAVAGRSVEEGAGWTILSLDRDSRLDGRLGEALADAGGRTVGAAAWDIWRIERGIPVYGRDFDLENFPQETGLSDRFVSFDKGCYTGQEVVARIHYRGHVNQRLLGVRREGGDGLREGSELYLAGRPAGRISSAVVSPSCGSIGLGMIRRGIEPGERLSTTPDGRAEIEVSVVPFTLM